MINHIYIEDGFNFSPLLERFRINEPFSSVEVVSSLVEMQKIIIMTQK
jgi:hypothetical protein